MSSVTFPDFIFYGVGRFGGPLEFKDDDGELKRYFQIQSLGNTLNMEVDEQVYRTPPPKGTPCRCEGDVVINKYMKYRLILNPDKLQIEGFTKDFKPLTQEEVFAGYRYRGWASTLPSKPPWTNKDGITFYNMLFSTFGGIHNLDVGYDLYREFSQHRGILHHDGRISPIIGRGKIDDMYTPKAEVMIYPEVLQSQRAAKAA